MVFYPQERLAIFIDGANLYSTIKTLDFEVDYKKLLELFGGKGRLQRAYYYTAIMDDDEFSPIKTLVDWLDYNGYHVISKPAKRYKDRDGRLKTKGNMDIEMAVDMLELASHIDHYLLFSGDGDFKYVVEALQKKGCRVTVISSMAVRPAMLADELRRQADSFIELQDLDKLIGRPAGGGDWAED
jgi:uncharacterized LabA/DUF88 family protein